MNFHDYNDYGEWGFDSVEWAWETANISTGSSRRENWPMGKGPSQQEDMGKKGKENFFFYSNEKNVGKKVNEKQMEGKSGEAAKVFLLDYI